MRRIVAHEPRRGAGARTHVRRDPHCAARVRDLGRRAGVAVRLPPAHDAPPPDRGDAGSRVAAAALQRCRRKACPAGCRNSRAARRRLALLRRRRARARRARRDPPGVAFAAAHSADRVRASISSMSPASELLVRRSAALRNRAALCLVHRPEARGSRACLERGGFLARFRSRAPFCHQGRAIRTIYPMLDPEICRRAPLASSTSARRRCLTARDGWSRR